MDCFHLQFYMVMVIQAETADKTGQLMVKADYQGTLDNLHCQINQLIFKTTHNHLILQWGQCVKQGEQKNHETPEHWGFLVVFVN